MAETNNIEEFVKYLYSNGLNNKVHSFEELINIAKEFKTEKKGEK